MTMLEAITEANDTAKIRRLSFARMDEFQAFMDSFKFTDYPINVVVPFAFNGSRTDNRNKVGVALQGWVITRIPQETIDFRSAKIEETFIAPMRQYGIKFINALLDTDIIDPEVTDISWTVRPEYGLTQSGVFGVSYTVTLPINETICTY